MEQVRGLLNPSIAGIEELFKNAETCLESQADVIDWTADNLDIEHNNEFQVSKEVNFMFVQRWSK